MLDSERLEALAKAGIDITPGQAGTAEPEPEVCLGVWRWNAETDEFTWSRNMFRIYEVDPAELRPTPRYTLQRVHALDRAAVYAAIRRALRDCGAVSVGYRIDSLQGGLRELESVLVAAQVREPVLVGAVRDLTYQRELERTVTANSVLADEMRA